MIVHVTQECIDKANRIRDVRGQVDPERFCPIFQAVRPLIDEWHEIRVNHNLITAFGCSKFFDIPLSRSAKTFIRKWDNRKDVAPITIHLKIDPLLRDIV